MNIRDDFDRRLSDDLKRHAAGIDPDLLSFDDVRRNAGRIRRRRALASGVVAAIAVVGVGGGAAALLDRGQPPEELAADAPSFHRDGPTPSIEPGTENDPADRSGLGLPSLDPAQLDQGEPPQVAWLLGDLLHTPDGRTIAIDGAGLHGYFTVVPVGDGWLAAAPGAKGTKMTVLNRDGRPQRIFDSNGFVHVTPDRSKVLFNDGQTLTLHDNDSGRTREIFTNTDETMTVVPVGVTDDGAVHFNLATANSGDPGDSRVWKDGQVTDPSPGSAEPTVTVNRQGSSVRVVEMTDFRSCSAVFGPEGAEQARTCDFRPTTFSPDGTTLLTWPGHFDGLGPMSMALLGEDWGNPLVEFVNYSADPGAETLPGFSEGVWEDDDHVLLAMRDGNDTANPWYVVRLGTDGEAELAAGPIDPGAEGQGLVLSGAN